MKKIKWYVYLRNEKINWIVFIKEPFVIHDIKDCWDNNGCTNLDTWECISIPKTLKIYNNILSDNKLAEFNNEILNEHKEEAKKHWIIF